MNSGVGIALFVVDLTLHARPEGECDFGRILGSIRCVFTCLTTFDGLIMLADLLSWVLSFLFTEPFRFAFFSIFSDLFIFNSTGLFTVKNEINP